MDDLVQWLRVQLDEDERTARAATAGPWEQSGIGEYGWGVSFSAPGAGVEAADSDQGRADAEHIAAWDPARVLREIDAKRQVIALHRELEDPQEMQDYCATCEVTGKYPEYPCKTLRLLALPYADRAGYRDEWRP
ncbi:DUF6221 family protein [Streptomyces ardesiacus]|uniref:DUF6221 family protein n=1 Tax=Streptomyces ardesiacus TaxID=285564 RepID=UPI003409219C